MKYLHLQMRSESKVIQGLDDFKNKDESIYQLHKIVYLKDKRNEIDTGLINMINVLIKICNLDHQEIWKDFEGFKAIDVFGNLLNKLNGNKSR